MLDLFGVQFPVAYVHVGALFLTGIAILIADKMALSWVRGKKETLPAGSMRALHLFVGIGLSVMILSGVSLAWPLREYLVGELSFWVKMIFVLILVVNSFFIGSATRLATTQSFTSLSTSNKRSLVISGGASTVGWVGAIVAAFFMTTSNWVIYIAREIFGFF